MHYTQYLALTYKIHYKRNIDKIDQTNKYKGIYKKNINFLLLVLFYGSIMAILSSFAGIKDSHFKFISITL